MEDHPLNPFGHADWPATCTCPRLIDAFEVISHDELKSPPTLPSLLQTNTQYMFVNQVFDYIFEGGREEGVYVLWQRIGYCEDHHHQVNEALYVGKGEIGRRLRAHYNDKHFPWDIVYVTYLPMINRIAKYTEQLILDLYGPSMNLAEKLGARTLLCCWDDGLLD